MISVANAESDVVQLDSFDTEWKSDPIVLILLLIVWVVFGSTFFYSTMVLLHCLWFI